MRTQVQVVYPDVVSLGGDPERALQMLHTVEEVLAERGLAMPWSLAINLARCFTLLRLGRPEEVVRISAAEIARLDGWNMGVVSMTATSAMGHRMCGRAEQALEILGPALRICRAGGPFTSSLFCFAEAAHSAALLGDVDSARSFTAEAGQHAPDAWGSARFWLDIAHPWISAAAGDIDAAVRQCRENADRIRDLGAVAFELIGLHDIVRLGRPDTPRRRLTELASTTSGQCASLYARHAQALADADGTALTAVADDFAELHMWLYSAEAATQGALAFKAAGAAVRSRVASAQAAERLRHCPGVRTPALAGLVTPELTSRERQIAELAAGGLSNQLIAERLGLSRRTVENHPYTTYTKLGVSTRSDLAGILGPDRSTNRRANAPNRWNSRPGFGLWLGRRRSWRPGGWRKGPVRGIGRCM
ncbi:helix-turn-helix transcriptional regulator [Fodinicola acaciae]|uniref:helix-turn-helix transcriptional regulator n=1 Tax=Fodinicola acaciae TaxID=2681555 RepID=UPI0013D894CE|nr:helix-turn-helix transcriptional regulator [Fodinicola acaciae]